ncbi:ribokinase [Halalkalibacter oceani]|nr:ribokinase [Halalkalibacter oceani]
MKNICLKPHVVVVGSINMDFVVTAAKWPTPGETIVATSFNVFPGGKGANQAVASARAGAKVSFVGAVGDDDLGQNALHNLEAHSINTKHVHVNEECNTGKALVTVVNGENSIIIDEGANGSLNEVHIEQLTALFTEADIVLMQNEIPFRTQEKVVEVCREIGVPVVYNPAPARKLSRPFLEKVQYLTPNEHEHRAIFSADKHMQTAFQQKVIQTKGKDGIDFWVNHDLRHIDSMKVTVVDTTGAGDTFNGVLATELARGYELEQAVVTANIAAALSVQKKGAQTGMPTETEIAKAVKKLK